MTNLKIDLLCFLRSLQAARFLKAESDLLTLGSSLLRAVRTRGWEWAWVHRTGCVRKRCLLMVGLLPFLSIASTLPAASSEDEPIDLELFIDGIEHWAIYSPIRDYERIDPSDVEGIAAQLIRYQNDDGGWPSNLDWLGKLEPEFLRAQLPNHRWESSFDNRNTYPQIRFLAHAYERTGNTAYRDAALRGVEYILRTQHASGGWSGSGVDAITFNESVMSGIMALLNDIGQQTVFAFVDETLRSRVATALEKALQVTLACQVRQNGMLTVWGQQHDHKTLLPVAAHSHELPALTTPHSAEVVAFLMSLEQPSQEVVRAVTAAMQWFRRSSIFGHVYVTVPVPQTPFFQTTVDIDRLFFEAPGEPPIWARFYGVSDGKPLLLRLDGTVVSELSELSFEQRVSCDWYGFWPREALQRFPKWLERNAASPAP